VSKKKGSSDVGFFYLVLGNTQGGIVYTARELLSVAKLGRKIVIITE
jgi:hypothetical protein